MDIDRRMSSSARSALQILGLFSLDSPTLGITELGRRLGLPKSNVARLVASLVSEGFLVRTPSGRYRLGFRLHDLGDIVVRTHELYGPAINALIEIRQSTGESSHMAVLDGVDVIHLERIRSDYVIRLTSGEWYRSPVHATSTGKVLLAFGTEAVQERVIERGLPRLTAATVTDAGRFRQDLARIRATGWAVCHEEFVPGISSVAVPILDAEQRVLATLAIVGAPHSLREARLKSMIPILKRAAENVARDEAFAHDVAAAIRRRRVSGAA